MGVLSRAWPGISPPDPALGLAVVAAVVLLAVLVRQLAAGQAERAAARAGCWSSGVRDTPAALRRLPQVRLAAPAPRSCVVAAAFSRRCGWAPALT